MAEYEPTPEAVGAFKRAWHEADAEGDEGNRVSRGLAAALAQHDAELRAEVERLRGVERGWQHDRAEWERERDKAERQVADLRAGIEALRQRWEDEVSNGCGSRREGLRVALEGLTHLAGSGEQPGEDECEECEAIARMIYSDPSDLTGPCSRHSHDRPAPVVPDGADVREVRTADGRVLTPAQVAALDGLTERLSWPSLHWGVESVSPEAWPHLAIAAADAALAVVRPSGQEGA